MIFNIKSKQIEKDFLLKDNDFVKKYKGKNKEQAKKCYDYYNEKGKILTTKIEDLMTEERSFVNSSFIECGEEEPNLEDLQKDTLIKIDIL